MRRVTTLITAECSMSQSIPGWSIQWHLSVPPKLLVSCGIHETLSIIIIKNLWGQVWWTLYSRNFTIPLKLITRYSVKVSSRNALTSYETRGEAPPSLKVTPGNTFISCDADTTWPCKSVTYRSAVTILYYPDFSDGYRATLFRKERAKNERYGETT